jgi:hypothetical protein
MKTIKKYWALIIAGLLGILSLTVFLGKKRSAKQVDKIDDVIDQNNKQVDINAGKIEVIEEIKQDVKEEIVEVKEDIVALEEQKTKPVASKKPKSAKAAKENILSKTNKKKSVKKK